ncbi:DNA alkylation repair protein [Candidatus Saccharibacteria bacterium]|nr:DNA alkylation repair protein [Candidatus Saccharibacteria bacterium]MCB9821460.1 DNA alkylation repair protein [Candidatus Nomurabacteria bacterium]
MLADRVIQELETLGDAKRAAGAHRFFKADPGGYGEGDQFIGVTMPQIRLACRIYRKLEYQEIAKLLASPIHEHRMAALIIMVDVFKKADQPTQTKLFELYLQALKHGQINNWDFVDVTCPHIVGAYLLDKPVEILYNLAESPNIWERRTAIISTFAFIRQGNVAHSLRIAEILLHDKHDLIHKAVGWTLREVGKRDGQATLTAFLDNHAHDMPRTALRYAIERLDQSLRKKYLNR